MKRNSKREAGAELAASNRGNLVKDKCAAISPGHVLPKNKESRRAEAQGKGAGKAAEDARDPRARLDTQSLQGAKAVDPKARHNNEANQKSSARKLAAGAGIVISAARPANSPAASSPGVTGLSRAAASSPANGMDGKNGTDVLGGLDERLTRSRRNSNAPVCGSFKEFLLSHAKVLQRDGSGGTFSMEGRAPLALIVDWLDKILRNTLDDQVVEIDGVEFAPGKLKGASVAVGGGAQFGKTILELNLMAYGTAIRFISVGNYLPDRPKVEEIVTQKFRPNVLDLYPWMAEMIQIGKVENASGKTIDRKESYTVTDGERKAFGNFCGMHKPPTSITIDLALLDEVDDIPLRNIGYVDARMTNSPVHLTCYIGTQRVSGAGQNARLKASSFHVKMVPCPKCKREWCLEEEWPRCVRVNRPQGPMKYTDPCITPEMGHDRLATYYVACPECAAPLSRDSGRYVPKHPERVAQARLGVRVSQLNISAISMQEIVGSWYASFEDPSGEALGAFYCDRIGIPNAGAAQPITQAVLDECRGSVTAKNAENAKNYEPYAMSLAKGTAMRVAGMDMGPRCWLWVDEVQSAMASACIWAELIASGNATTRLPLLMGALGVQCVFLDAGGEPDLTKRLVLALNGLDNYSPPVLPKTELLKSRLGNLGVGLSWDGERARWKGIRAAAVLFVAGEARGIEQTIGFTQEGRIYPLIKCNRSESIQTAVNDFLTPQEGVLELVNAEGGLRNGDKVLRTVRRARLPNTYIGAGVSQAVFDGHLLNLRKEKDPRTGAEDWIEGVENHLGLAKTYARLAATMVDLGGRLGKTAFSRVTNIAQRPMGSIGMGRFSGRMVM